jgi:hypothetical protein
MEKMDQAPKSNPGVADVSKPKSNCYNLVAGKTKRDNPPFLVDVYRMAPGILVP